MTSNSITEDGTRILSNVHFNCLIIPPFLYTQINLEIFYKEINGVFLNNSEMPVWILLCNKWSSFFCDWDSIWTWEYYAYFTIFGATTFFINYKTNMHCIFFSFFFPLLINWNISNVQISRTEYVFLDMFYLFPISDYFISRNYFRETLLVKAVLTAGLFLYALNTLLCELPYFTKLVWH